MKRYHDYNLYNFITITVIKPVLWATKEVSMRVQEHWGNKRNCGEEQNLLLHRRFYTETLVEEIFRLWTHACVCARYIHRSYGKILKNLSRMQKFHERQCSQQVNFSDLFLGYHIRFKWTNWSVSTRVRSLGNHNNKRTNSVVLVLQRTIPTERQPLICEVSVNFWGQKVSRGPRNGSPRPYSRPSWPEQPLFLQSSSSIVLTRPGEPRSKSINSQKIW
jgi:hypothetical protein